MNKNTLYSLGICITFCLLAPKNSQSQINHLNRFVPSEYDILDSATADINKDGINDWVLVLKNKMENDSTEQVRPLLLLQGTKQGSFTCWARNDSVVYCKVCGGIYGDPYAGLTVKQGSFTVEHYGGSNWRWTRNITFTYNTKTKKLVLKNDRGENWHISEPNRITYDVFHKQDFGKLTFQQYSINKP